MGVRKIKFHKIYPLKPKDPICLILTDTMKSLIPLFFAFTATYVQALTNYPEFQYRVGYIEPTIEQYNATDDTLMVDDEGNPVLADFEFQYANLYGGHSCISVFPGANSLSLIDIPLQLERLIGPDRKVGMDRLFGWVMYPGSNACNLDLKEEDRGKAERVLLSLDQAKYGYAQINEDQEDFREFPLVPGRNGYDQPPSFRLFVNPELFNPGPGVESFIDLPFSSVGKNAAIPKERFKSNRADWSDVKIGDDDGLNPNNRVVRQYAPFGFAVTQPREEIDRIIAPKRRIRPGNPGYSNDINDYRPYPDLYPMPDNRTPMEVFRPIIMLARLGDDLDSGRVTMEELELIEPEVDAFAEAFMGLPFSTDPDTEHLIPARYDWPPLSTLSYLSETPGLIVPDLIPNLLNFYSENGHTLSEAIKIAQTLNANIGSWLEGQPANVLGDWGVESSPQLKAEKWLYDLEEGTWEDTGSMNTIPDRPTRKPQLENAEVIFDFGEDVRVQEPGAENDLNESLDFRPKRAIDRISDFNLDEEAIIESTLPNNEIDVNLGERPDELLDINGGEVVNSRPIYSNLGSRVLQNEGQLEQENIAAVREFPNDIVSQVEAQQDNPAEEIQNQSINQNQIPAGREEAVEELQRQILDQPVLQLNPGPLNRIAEVDESEVRSQGAQSLANPNMESMELGRFDQLSQSQQLLLGNALQAGDLTSILGELYSDRQPRWLGKVRMGGRKRSPGPG
ncbi:hypothetical protein TWF225_010080 [Orbilia oligospora]|nr:hypothetical protein TWF225_010080 [Orbilia oligospora]